MRANGINQRCFKLDGSDGVCVCGVCALDVGWIFKLISLHPGNNNIKLNGKRKWRRWKIHQISERSSLFPSSGIPIRMRFTRKASDEALGAYTHQHRTWPGSGFGYSLHSYILWCWGADCWVLVVHTAHHKALVHFTRILLIWALPLSLFRSRAWPILTQTM